jgi:hypothetical protein
VVREPSIEEVAVEDLAAALEELDARGATLAPGPLGRALIGPMIAEAVREERSRV